MDFNTDRPSRAFPEPEVQKRGKVSGMSFQLKQGPMKFQKIALPLVLVAGALVPTQAHALSTGFQDTTTQSFSASGSTTTNGPLSFPRFDPSTVNPAHLNPTLVGFQFFVPSATLSGKARLICDDYSTVPINSCPLPGPFPVSLALSFDSIVQANPTPTPISVGPIAGQAAGPIGSTFTFTTLSGSVPPPAGGLYSSFFTALLSAANYTAPGPNVSVDFWNTQWSMSVAGISPQFFGSADAPNDALVSGQVGIRYVYTYTGSSVPGPVPVIGAGAAFAFSRRLRKRVSQGA